MRATIMPQENHIRINDEPITVAAGLMPEGPALEGFVPDAARPIEVISFDGAIGVIQRKSRAPGRVDMEHFLGSAPLDAYRAVFESEKARMAAEKRAKNEAEEARAKLSAELAAAAAAEQEAKFIDKVATKAAEKVAAAAKKD